MSMRELILILIFCSVLVLLSGCQSADVTAAPAVAAKASQIVPPKRPGEAQSAQKKSDTKSPAGPTPASLAEHSRFEPPFPDRGDMFEPPKRAQRTAVRSDEHGQAIELKGFVNVDGPQVVLAIDGVISPIPEGGEKYGVHVISVEPPSVVLQRGRSRPWTATLE